MKEFFGIDMTYIMIALLAVLFIAVSTILYVFVRNRVMFQIGVRNIPRRRAQTILIIIGLMLSTLIISTALEHRRYGGLQHHQPDVHAAAEHR